MAPLPDAAAVFRAAEVVFVLRLGVPSALAPRLARLATIRFGAVVLAATVAVIRSVKPLAMQTLEFGLSFHRQTRCEPPKVEESTPAFREENHAAPARKKTGRRTEKKSFGAKLGKKIPPLSNPIFKPPDLSDSQIATVTKTAGRLR